MKNKYHEYIIIYLSVAIGCFAIGLIVRATVVAQGVDAFSANTIFWLIAGLGIISYCVLTIAIKGLLDKTGKLLFPKPKQVKEVPKPEEELVKQLSLDEIRAEKQKELALQYTEKLNTAIRYTQETLALYVSDADMDLLCENIEIYAAGSDLNTPTFKPVKVKDLTTVDICHFGWNIWNNFDVTDQWGIARFLKAVFEEKLKDMELKTIKKKLKIFEPNSTIQIEESLNKTDDTK
ncbi:mobilization protein [Parabacteroides sp. PFB2-10]|uniref:mobilization protein n=1 Tax=Parabacteroides sp. PFB2-10 TaxID=1742405 RepID=UPI002476DEE3|nr:mobilization protein [Parabacteroides sp. PFB2-10]